MSMLTAVLFIAVLVGLIRPGYVKKRRAFGLAIIFIVAVVIGTAIDVAGSTSTAIQMFKVHKVIEPGDPSGVLSNVVRLLKMLVFLNATMVVLKTAATISLLIAYWPGGKLFNITGQSAETEKLDTQDS